MVINNTQQNATEASKTYLADPEYFKKIMVERNYQGKGLGERNVKIAYEYLDGGLTLDKVGKNHNISGSRVRQLTRRFLALVAQLSTQRTDPASPESVEEQPKPRGNPKLNHLSQEEYDKAKEMLFTGLGDDEIGREIGRSSNVVGRIRNSTSLEDYFEQSRLKQRAWGQMKREQREKQKREEEEMALFKQSQEDMADPEPLPEQLPEPQITEEKPIEDLPLEEVLRQIERLKDRFPKYRITFDMNLKGGSRI